MIRVVVQQQRRLDRDALAALIRQTGGLDLVAALTSDWETVAVSKLKRPDVVILDTAMPLNGAVAVANCLLRNGHAKHVIFLGDTPDESRDSSVPQMPNSGHLTRNTSHGELWDYIARHCSGEALNAERRPATLHQADVDLDRTLRVDAPELATLSPRETEVFRLLAKGDTVLQCAKKLRLSVSTLDNHKARIMKKLKVHRTVDLVRLAIREGIIEP